mgnify:FL=1
MATGPITYKDAGVDIDKADVLVDRIKQKVVATYDGRVRAGVGGFACLYDIGNGKLLAAGTDGVGTKLKLARTLGKHDTIGIDLVAMCVNDVICTGAKPLFFMDYIATGVLDVGVAEAIVEGIVTGCQSADAALIGGETAEMPGLYGAGEYDLAGFAIGEVMEADVIDGSAVKAGDYLVALPSSGVHANGFSLLQRVITPDEAIYPDCLTPTRIYWPQLKALLAADRSLVHGLAHITGGGLTNLARINARFDYRIDTLPSDIPPVFAELRARCQLDTRELYRTFNMGIGFVIATPAPDRVLALLAATGEHAQMIGQAEPGAGVVRHGEVVFT